MVNIYDYICIITIIALYQPIYISPLDMGLLHVDRKLHIFLKG